MRPSRTQLDAARRAAREPRMAFGETSDRVWHRLVPGSCVVGTARLVCTGKSRDVRRTAADMPESEITCGDCRQKEGTNHVG